jgi:cytochrome c biogenesis protein CcmG/thiol:disulfide interchange protein DsbE
VARRRPASPGTHAPARSTDHEVPRAGASIAAPGRSDGTVVAVASRRIPLPAVLLSTALALAAALGTFALLDDGDGGAAGDEPAEGYELTPAGDVPGSVDEVRLVPLDGGEERRLGDLVGSRPVVVNFFASWCAPCVEEMPAFEAVHQDVGDQVTLIGMANQDAPENALETVAATGVTYPTFGDPDGDALTFFGGLAMPTTVFIDTDGEVVEVHSGALTEDELRAKLGELFGVEA